MSYDVSLIDPDDGSVLPSSENFEEGGTYAIGGTNDCELNITYNYSEVFRSLVSDLDGQRASDTLHALREFVSTWAHAKPYQKDYWAPTPGNAKMAIERLVKFAEEHPDGVWAIG